jgi:membrane-bound metal-dependent hydrolase YbcI (DUF457 family)
MLLLMLAVLWHVRQPQRPRLRWLFWFSASCLLHSLIDIPTHENDGPLLLFPFEWSIRFASPISYWDPNAYGREFALFELTLDIILLGYLFMPGFMQWMQRRRRKPFW